MDCDPYRRNAKQLIVDLAWCLSCATERERGTLDMCECGDSRPPIAPRSYVCIGFVPHPKCPNLCARCGAGSKARNEHLKSCLNLVCSNYVDDFTDALCLHCEIDYNLRRAIAKANMAKLTDIAGGIAAIVAVVMAVLVVVIRVSDWILMAVRLQH